MSSRPSPTRGGDPISDQEQYPWGKHEDEILIRDYAEVPVATLAAWLDRSKDIVKNRARRLGLTKTTHSEPT